MERWSRNAVKGHLMASFQTLHRLRGEVMEAKDAQRFAAGLSALAEHLSAEAEWLSGFDPVPPERQRSREAALLARYAQRVMRTLTLLAEASRRRPLEPATFGDAGVALLALMSEELEARRL